MTPLEKQQNELLNGRVNLRIRFTFFKSRTQVSVLAQILMCILILFLKKVFFKVLVFIFTYSFNVFTIQCGEDNICRCLLRYSCLHEIFKFAQIIC